MRADSYLEEKVIYMEQKIAIQDTYGERFQHCWGWKMDPGAFVALPRGNVILVVCRKICLAV